MESILDSFIGRISPFDLEVFSHRDRLDQDGSKLFSRDLVTILHRRKGAPQEEQPFLAIIGTHNKSQRDSPGDPRSVQKRARQVLGALKEMKELKQKYSDRLPIVYMRDLNADVQKALEFKPLWDDGLRMP